MKQRFGLTGVGGYVAPKHLQAITDTGNQIVAALDPHDAVGVLDRFSLDVDFFTEPERFERYLNVRKLDWLSVCSPNYLHDVHTRMGMRAGCNVICEKPLALSPWNLDEMVKLEYETGRRVWTILQLRLHPAVLVLKAKLDAEPKYRRVALTYCTPRGRWYARSWKGDVEKSGGLVTNIGIHLLDLVLWLFGPLEKAGVTTSSPDSASGMIFAARGEIAWDLSLLSTDGKPQRSLQIEGLGETKLDAGFADLHTKVYERTLSGNGFSIEDARPSVELAYRLRRP